MQSALTLITAASLLLHTLLGCCSHGAVGPCACGHDAHSHAGDGDLRAHGDSHVSGGCEHAHDDERARSDEHADDDRANHADGPAGDQHDPAHPCHCHCAGNRCQAIVAASAPAIEIACSALMTLPPLVATSADCGDGARGRGGADTAFAKTALPVRAHLLYQTLLI